MKGKKNKVHFFKQERTRIYEDKRHDVYKSEKKHRGNTVCPKCLAFYQDGRWTWDTAPSNSAEIVCPACQRIEDGYPGGILMLSGPFYLVHKKEILQLVQNIHKTEKYLHPLERIMKIRHNKNGSEITTTGMHLARRIGDGINKAYQGELEYSYEGENYIRANWNR